MFDFEYVKKVATQKGISEVEIYEELSTQVSIESSNEKIEKNEIATTDVCAIRGVYNNQLATVYVEDNSTEALEEALESLKDNAGIMTKDDPFFIYGGDETYPEVVKEKTDFDLVPQEEKVAFCLKIENEMRKVSKAVTYSEISYNEVTTKIIIKNSNGLDVSDESKNLIVFAEAVATEGDSSYSAYDFKVTSKFADLDAAALAKTAVDKAVSRFGADTIKSGNYKVLFSNEQAITVLCAFSSMFSAEAVLKNMSLLKDKIGQNIFGENINIIDDPLDSRATTRRSFDDEGVASVTTNIVTNGKLNTFLHNLATAKQMNTVSTSNGYKAGVAGKVGVSTSNLYLKDTGDSFQDMLREIENGVYITELMGAHAGVNALSGDFSLQASGFEIKDGKVGKPLTLMIVSGNIVSMLNSVKAVGTDFKYQSGVGSGSVYVSTLSISGK